MTITKPKCEPLGDFILGLGFSVSFKGSQNGRFKVHSCYVVRLLIACHGSLLIYTPPKLSIDLFWREGSRVIELLFIMSHAFLPALNI